MKKLKKFNQLFEADLKDILPEDYLKNIEDKAREMFGEGPQREDFMNSMRLMQVIMRKQQGHLDELTEIGKEIILNHYGSILDGVELDIKIVNPDNPEKMEMVQKALNKKEDEEDQEDEENQEDEDMDYGSEFDIESTIKAPEDEVRKRKLLNNIMQGEGQNVHSMMFAAKDKVDAIDPDLLQYYIEFLNINRKFDWDPNKPDLSKVMEDLPELANMSEVDWKKPKGEKGEKGEKGRGGEEEQPQEEQPQDTTPVIKARVLDLPMLIHETVKAIYELMAANAIPENEEMAKKIMDAVDSLEDEEEDIKYGPFIAADIRDYLNDYLERKFPLNVGTQAMKEFIYGEMIALNASDFVELIRMILSGDVDESDILMRRHHLIENVIELLEQPTDVTEEEIEEEPLQRAPRVERTLEREPDALSSLDIEPKEEKDWKDKDYINMSQGEIENLMNAELDKDEPDYNKLKELQRFIKTKD